MATDKAPTKAEFMEALKEKGITTLDELLDAIMPETAGYVDIMRDSSEIGSSGHTFDSLSKYFGIGIAGDVGLRGPRYGGPDIPNQ